MRQPLIDLYAQTCGLVYQRQSSVWLRCIPPALSCRRAACEGPSWGGRGHTGRLGARCRDPANHCRQTESFINDAAETEPQTEV